MISSIRALPLERANSQVQRVSRAGCARALFIFEFAYLITWLTAVVLRCGGLTSTVVLLASSGEYAQALLGFPFNVTLLALDYAWTPWNAYRRRILLRATESNKQA